MKTKKLNLNELKVESFVTSLEGKDAQTVKGGNPIVALGVSETLGVALIATYVVLATVGVAAGYITPSFAEKKEEKKEECKK